LFERQDAIKTFRQQVRKTFMMLTEKTIKDEWAKKIDLSFGYGYTEKKL
jgi:hypothetical protein